MLHLCKKPCEVKIIKEEKSCGLLNNNGAIIKIMNHRDKNIIWAILAYILEPIDKTLVEAHLKNLKKNSK